MNRPNVVTRLLGNQIVAATALIGTAIGGLAWMAGLMPLPLVFFAFGLAVVCARAHASVKAYKEWHAQWNELEEPAPQAAPEPKASAPRGNRVLVILMLTSWVVLVFTVKTPQQKTGLAYFTIGIILYGLVALVMRIARGRNVAPTPSSSATARDDRVAICIDRPVVPVPHLREAYLQLPGYCHDLFAGQTRP